MQKGEKNPDNFDITWKERKESRYNHWTKGEPGNQIQLAFRQHWEVFQEIMGDPLFNTGKRVLEVGCGRGSLSAYFAQAGYQCTLLDISPTIIQVARDIFSCQGLQADFVVGDAYHLPFLDSMFDLVFSIGLLEHFEDIEGIIAEQFRILDTGGLFIGYVVPENKNNIQKDYAWINDILKGYMDVNHAEKPEVFRSDSGSPIYLEIMNRLGFFNIQASGVYPLPMISHSIEFPFSLMPEQSESKLVDHFKKILAERRAETGRHPWYCDESLGQAFLVWGLKK